MTDTSPNDSLQKERQLYSNTLTYNVIGRYDPKLEVLLFQTSHCQLYKYDANQEWEKLEYQGVLAIYSRTPADPQDYTHGIIILNRTKPENFSLGLNANSKLKEIGKPEIKTDYQTEYIIIKNTDGDIYGFWIHEISHRKTISELIKAIISA